MLHYLQCDFFRSHNIIFSIFKLFIYIYMLIYMRLQSHRPCTLSYPQTLLPATVLYPQSRVNLTMDFFLHSIACSLWHANFCECSCIIGACYQTTPHPYHGCMRSDKTSWRCITGNTQVTIWRLKSQVQTNMSIIWQG